MKKLFNKKHFQKEIEPVDEDPTNETSNIIIGIVVLAIAIPLLSISLFGLANIHNNQKDTGSVSTESTETEQSTVAIIPSNNTTVAGVTATITPNVSELVTQAQQMEQQQASESKQKEDERNQKIAEAQAKIAALDTSDKMQWFIQYKAIQDEYAEWIDKDETIYDIFTDDELNLLFEIVEAEVTGEDHFQSKVNVASVIFNRLYHDTDNQFPDDLTGILTAKSQFSSYSDGRYKKVTVTDTTKLAVEYAFQIGGNIDGSLYFDSCKGKSWANSKRQFVFQDSVKHNFYK